jgi:hypothetical protein
MTRGLPLKSRVPRVLGLGLVLGAVLLAPNLLYENGLWQFLRLFRGQDQQLHNTLYLSLLSWVPSSWDESSQLAVLQVVKLVLKLIFLGVGALIAYRVYRRGAALTPDYLFGSIVVLLLVYFSVGSPEIHEWYVGWFLCFVFWVNNRAYYNLGMVLTTALNALAILTVRCPTPIVNFAWSICFFILWLGLYYLWKQQQGKSWQPSPLSGPGVADDGREQAQDVDRRTGVPGRVLQPLGSVTG